MEGWLGVAFRVSAGTPWRLYGAEYTLGGLGGRRRDI